MATEQPSEQALERFDEALNDATHAVVAEFEWMGLPDDGSDQRTALLHRINDALTAIMYDWL